MSVRATIRPAIPPRANMKRTPRKQADEAIAAASRVSETKPEFLRIPEAVKFSGLSRSHLYSLMASRELDSVCIIRHGNERGVRLIKVSALRALMEKHSSNYNQ